MSIKLKKLFLYLTGFFCGMSVMAIELGASRLMAPYFSSSQIVYTIIIGTVMIAMAIGNILGGKMADKYKSPDRLFAMIFIAACWICLIPVVGKYIIAGIALLLAASSLGSNFLVWAAFLSCFVVFVFPLMILGMVTPNLIKYAVGSLDESGKVVGTIEALNTIGSIIGTFLPTFVTIPFIGTSWTFIIFSIILFIICLVYFFLVRRKRIVYSAVAGVFIVGSIVGSQFGGIAFWNTNTVYEGESIYNYLRVEENENDIILSTNVLFGVQSVKKKKGGLTGMYYDYAIAANAMAKNPDGTLDILMLGLGTGTYAVQTEQYFTDTTIDGVEIDGEIVKLAKTYFSLPEDVNAIVGDGRSFITSTDKKYDVILVDAYQDITIPFQMSSVEFFTIVKEHLNEGGVMVINMNMYTNNEGGINDYLSSTVCEVFDTTYGVVANSNYELFACNGFDLKDELTGKLDSMTNSDLKRMMTYISKNLEVVEDKGYRLTDNKAPVELLGMSVLDDMIFEELDYYRSMIRGKSIPELIEMIQEGKLF